MQYKILLILLFLLTLQADTHTIGAQKVASSSLEKGTLFASVSGTQNHCSKEHPCSIQTAFSKLKAGSTLFLKGGTYNLKMGLHIKASGTLSEPIIIESYPDERAILNGNQSIKTITKNHNVVRHGIYIAGKNHITIRNIDIKNMGATGIKLLYSSHNRIEGCHIYNNFLSGISLYGGHYNKPYKPYKYGYNTIENNIIYNNSDAGLNLLQKVGKTVYSYEDGDNADGISVSSGKYNSITHNTVYANADDGIDLWRSNDSYAAYNLVYKNGKGKGGNGNGIKAGGNLDPHAPNGLRAVVEYNIAYNNKRRGFSNNAGKKVTFRYNTAYRNGTFGFTSSDDTLMHHNIALDNGAKVSIKKGHHTNSWQGTQKVSFISTSPLSCDFLKLKKNYIGAYTTQDNSNTKIFLIGDSTVFNTAQGEMGWGSKLGALMKNPHALFNQARSGASSSSYKTLSKHHHHWENTKALIKKTDIRAGAYLFIQFGHNNKDKNTTRFYNDLKTYLKEAKALGLIPVLITPISRLYKYDKSHGVLPQIVRDLAKDENVLLLDLQEKSWHAFNEYPSHQAIATKFAYDDHTHFNPQGAAIIAGWIKELACEADSKLCSIFK